MSLTGRLGDHSLLYYGASLTAITLSSVIIFLFYRRMQNTFEKRGALVPIASALALASAATMAAMPYLDLIPAVYDTIAVGCAVVWSCCLCIIFFAWLSTLGTLMFELDMRTVVSVAALAGVAGFFLIPVMFFETPFYRFIAIASLCASGLIWMLCKTESINGFHAESAPSGGKLDLSSLRHWGALFVAYLLASILHAVFYAMDAGIDLEMYTLPCYIIVGTFGLIIAFSLFPRSTKSASVRVAAPWHTGVSMSIGLFIGLLLAMLLFDFGDREASLNFMSAANRCLQVLIFIALLLLVYQQRMSPVVAFALLFMSVEVLSNLICYFIAPAVIGYFQIDVASSITSMSSVIGAALIAALVFSLAVFALSDSMKTMVFERGSEEGADGPLGAQSEDWRAVRCAAIAAEHQLTQREQDVLYYLSLGYNAKRIADTLYVSFETVRSHTSGIYRKMDVHSKQDLIDRVNNADSLDR